jgi:hypothetical protein
MEEININECKLVVMSKIAKNRCKHNLFVKQDWNQLHYLMYIPFDSFKMKSAIKKKIQIISKDSKRHLYCIQYILKFLLV